MLASTCNNLKGLAELATDFLDQIMGLIIVDKAAFDNEYSLCIPLSLRPYMSLIVGDHYQLQPVVASKGFQEFSEQCQMSLFQRCVDYQDVKGHRHCWWYFCKHLPQIQPYSMDKPSVFEAKSRFLIPLHVGNNHWQLIDFDRKSSGINV
ncbi:hypothetical protein F5884DRAFT_852249 [Xylogone sp. PMI_703]|nr:hypothetical protein F5884DRAFT_852249 [Xylogone sp. PMI_703]